MAAEPASPSVVADDPDQLLIGVIERSYADPEYFVHVMYPWGQPGTVLADESGPDEWQASILRMVGEQVEARFQPDHDLPNAIRIAIASGNGIGKTTLIAWIIHWFISTRPFPQIVATANTKTQLSSKTWRELAKWHSLALNAHWFEWTATTFKLKDKPEMWCANATPWSKSNAQAFAGTHEQHVLMLFDEASNIEDVIWETAEGAMTTPGAMWFAFGNPMKNTGRFRECWTRFRKRWITAQVDSRTAKKADQKQIAEWIEDYGLDSDFVRSHVLGEFPSAGPMQLIPVDVVDKAVARVIDPKHISPSSPVLMGVDVARGGSAQSVILVRQGPKAYPELFKYRVRDLMKLAGFIAEKINKFRPDTVFIDATGMGAGVYDRLVQLGYDNVVAVYSGDRSMVSEPKRFYNPRIETWYRMGEWLKTGDIPNDRELREDLIAPEYFFDVTQLMRLEPKEELIARGIPSPDCADALALTFSHAVPVRRVNGPGGGVETEPEIA